MIPLVKKWPVAVIVALFVFVVAGCGGGSPLDNAQSNGTQSQEEQEANWQVADFTYTDQDGKKFGLADLKGDVWLADFIFTNCVTVCPPMTANMVKIQKALKDNDANIPIVSFSVDPDVDTPETLQKYAKENEMDLASWHLLTGYKQEEIAEFSQESFKSIVQDDPNSDQVIHGTKFYLVDGNGKVVKMYDGLKPPVDDIIKDIKALK